MLEKGANVHTRACLKMEAEKKGRLNTAWHRDAAPNPEDDRGWSLLHACAVSCDKDNFDTLVAAITGDRGANEAQNDPLQDDSNTSSKASEAVIVEKSSRLQALLKQDAPGRHSVAMFACGCRCTTCVTPGMNLYPENYRVSPKDVIEFLKCLRDTAKKIGFEIELGRTVGTVVRRKEGNLLKAFLRDDEFKDMFWKSSCTPDPSPSDSGSAEGQKGCLTPEGMEALEKIMERWPEGMLYWLAHLPVEDLDERDNTALHLAVQHCSPKNFTMVLDILRQNLLIERWFKLLRTRNIDGKMPIEVAKDRASKNSSEIPKYDLLMQQGAIHALLFKEPQSVPQHMLQPMPALVFFQFPGNIQDLRMWYLQEKMHHPFLIIYLGKEEDLQVLGQEGCGGSNGRPVSPSDLQRVFSGDKKTTRNKPLIWYHLPIKEEEEWEEETKCGAEGAQRRGGRDTGGTDKAQLPKEPQNRFRDCLRNLLNLQKAQPNRVYRFDKNWRSKGVTDPEHFQDLSWLDEPPGACPAASVRPPIALPRWAGPQSARPPTAPASSVHAS